MKPSYKQARPEAAVNIPLATKAKQVEAWLDALPHGDPLASAHALANYLAAHDSAQVAAAFRRQLFDIVAVGARRVLNTLEAEFRDMPLPMDANQLEHADHALDLLGAAGDFCKRLILEFAERSPPIFGENPLPGHLGRFLHLQREVMDLCYLGHRQLPDGFWRDTHQTGLLLFDSGLAAAPDPTRPSATLGELYLALLLEASADPYHLTEQERAWTLDVIARYGNLARVEPVRTAAKGGVFGILAHEDKPPYPLSWQNEIQPNCELVMNTAPLVRKLALIISQLGRESGLSKAVPAPRQPGYKGLLQRLKSIWGGSSQRTTARHRPARSNQRTAIVGFYPIHLRLSDPGGPFDDAAMVSCQLVNESLGGMALLVAKPVFRLKIGSLVCVGRGQGDAWNDIGLVRWFKTGPNGVLTFGIKYLHGKMRPCLWRLSGNGQDYPGLLAEPEKGRPRVARSLIMPALRIDALARLEMRQGDERFAIKLAGKVEALAEIDIFRCEQDSA